MIIDIIIIAIIALLTIIGYKRGIVKSLYGLIIIALAGFLAYLCGKLLAELIYDNFIFASISDSVNKSFASSKVNSTEVSSNIFESIPDYLTNMLSGFGITQRGFATTLNSASDFSQNAVLTAVEKVIKPIIVSAISVFFIIILFILFILLLKLIGRFILKLFKLPGIRWINAILGGAFGLLEGVLIVLIAVIIIRISSSFTNNSLVSKELIESSYIFKYIYNLDFISFISNINH